MTSDKQQQYTADEPIASRHEDRFSRWPFAERIAHVLANRTDSSSIVIGIYGPWGDGKTSVLNMMAEALKSDDGVIWMPFNPWHFEDEQHLISAFFNTLADAIGKSLTTKTEELGRFLQQYGSILSLARVGFGTAAADLGEKLSSVHLDELKRRVNALLRESGKRVIVFIDDIDRLDRAEIHAILKLIKLSASFANTAYVVAFDDEVVAASLGDRYGAGGLQAGHQFLEKVIQVSLHLPDAEDTDLRILSFEGVDSVLRENSMELTEDDAAAFVRHFTHGFMAVVRTPRQVKRYVNGIRFAVPLLKGEVHIVDQLLIEALRNAYPQLYLSIRANPDIYTGEHLTGSFDGSEEGKEQCKAVVDAALTGLTLPEREAAVDLLKALFPRIDSIYGNTFYGNEWDKQWASERRIASSDYFRRYFQHSVPKRDVADRLVSGALAAAEADDAGGLDAFFAEVSHRGAWQRCLDKLFARTAEVGPVGSRALALNLAKRAASIPTEPGMFSLIMASSSRAAGLVAQLVRSIEDQSARLASATGVVTVATSLPFAADCLRWLGGDGGDELDGHGLTEDDTKAVGGALAERIARDFSGNVDYCRYGGNIGTMLRLWRTYGPEGALTSFLSSRFGEHPDEAVRFLDAFVGRAWGVGSGLSHKGEFNRGGYDSVTTLIDPIVVVRALKKSVGSLLDDMTFEKCRQRTGDERTACLFVAIHNKVSGGVG